MHRYALIIVLLLVPALAARGGQQGPTPKPAPDAPQASPAPQASEPGRERIEQIRQRLALTPEQIERVRPIMQAEAQKLKALRDKHQAGGGGRRDRRKLARELREIQQSIDAQLKDVLSADQMRELKAMRAERRQQMRERAGRD